MSDKGVEVTAELSHQRLVADLVEIGEDQRADLARLFEDACNQEAVELIEAALAALDLVPGPLRRAVKKVAGL